MTRHDTSGNTLRQMCSAIYRHRGKAVLFFLSVVAAVALVTFLSPKEYRSEGKLFFRLGRENAMLDPTATLGQNSIIAVPSSRENEINSVVEILQSRVLAEKVVERDGARGDSEFHGRRQFRRRSRGGNGLRRHASAGRSADRGGVCRCETARIAVQFDGQLG